MNPRRGVGFAAADNAGAIASRNGRARVTPAPCKNVRLDNAFFEMNMTASLLARAFSHLERNAFHNAQYQRRKLVIARRGSVHDFTYCWSIIILQVPSDGIHQ